MPIRLRCKCGVEVAADESMQGKAARCSQCGFQFTVPTTQSPLTPAASTSDAFLVRCTECGSTMGESSLVCLDCGYHRELKRKIGQPRAVSAPGAGGAFIIFASLVLLLALVMVQHNLDGPQFIRLYFFSFLVLGVLTVLVRKFYRDVDLVNYCSMLVLLGGGAYRILYSIANERYRLAFLVIGMVGAFLVFMLSRTQTENERCDIMKGADGGLHLLRYGMLLGSTIALLGIVYFAAGHLFKGPTAWVTAVFSGLGSIALLAGRAEGGGGGSYYGSGCSSGGGGGCGGGGCGGGCGGCGG